MSRADELDDRSKQNRGGDRRNLATLRDLSHVMARPPLVVRWIGAFAAGIVMIAAATSMRADIRWMEPETPVVTPGASIWVGLTEADEFGPSAAARLVPSGAGLIANLAGQPLTVVPAPLTGGLKRFSVTLPRPGVAVFVSDLPEEHRTISNGDVERYLRAMYATDDLRTNWAEFPAESPWRETFRQRLKTYVRVGQPAGDERAWSVAQPQGLDLTPLVDPTACRENQELAVSVTDDGRPLAGCIVSFLSQGETREHVEVTDGDGRATAPLDARGAWLIRGIRIRRATGPDRDWATEVTGVTLYVR